MGSRFVVYFFKVKEAGVMMSKESHLSHADEFSRDEFPIEDEKYGVKATLYVRKPEPDSDLRIVLKSSENRLIDLDKSLLPFPSWFAKSYFLLESEKLERRVEELERRLKRRVMPKDDAYVDAVFASLSRKVVEYLTNLIDNNEDLFRKIEETRALEIKAIACEDDDFFAKVVDLVTFKTSDSQTFAFGTYDAKAKSRICGLEGTASWGCFPVDKETTFLCLEHPDEREFIKNLIKKLREKMNPPISIRYYMRERNAPECDICGGAYLQYWCAPDSQDFAAGKNQSLTEVLDIRGVEVQAGYLTPNLPAIIVDNPAVKKNKKESKSERPRRRSGIAAVFEERLLAEPEILKLNIDHPMVSAVLSLTNRELLSEALRAFYHNALLLSGKYKGNEMKMAHEAFFDVMGHLLNDYQSQHMALPEHTRIFMAMPYQSKFNAVENAVREFLEGPPYYFELFLDRDRTSRTGELLDNLRRNIGAAKSMIADISGLNDNVLMELGVIHLRYGEKRPLFLICSSKYQDKYKKNPTSTKYPADLGDKLITFYNPSTQKSIYQSLQDNMSKQDALQDLLKDRRAKYLSEFLLKQFRNERENYGTNFEDDVFSAASKWIRKNYKNDLELLETDEKVWESELDQASIAVVSSLKNWLK